MSIRTANHILKKCLVDCRNDPVKFSRLIGWTIPGVNELVPHQRTLVMLVAAHKIAVVPAGHSVGKSLCCALLICWWLLTRGPGSMVIVTAPSANLVGSVIFKELRRLVRTSRIPLGGEITRSARASPQTWTLGSDGWMCWGFATVGAERAQGQHAKHLLAIVDEASGVSSEIYQSVHSWKYEKLVLCGNPLKSSGDFVDLFKRSRLPSEQDLPPKERCVSYVISSLDSPDIHLKKSPRGLADQGFLQEIDRVYGLDSLYARLHVDIDKDNPFPISDAEQLIPNEWLDRCVNVSRHSGGPRALAVDLAKGTGRDRTCILVGDAFGLYHVWQSNSTSLEDAARMVRSIAQQFGVPAHRVVYDSGGWCGSDMERFLSAVGFGQARKYYGNDSGGSRYANKRSWAAWKLRSRLDPALPSAKPYQVSDPTMPLYGPESFIHPQPTPQPPFHIPMGSYWPELREELAGLRYNYSKKKMALEKKESFTMRLGRSPDIGDSMLMLISILYGEMDI